MDQTTLLHRTLSGAASEAEKREVESWLAASRANRDEFEDLKLLWDFPERGIAKDGKYYDGLVRIRQGFEGARRRRTAVRAGMGLAAALLIVAVAAGVLFNADSQVATRVLEFDDASLRNVLHTIEEEFNVVVETPGEGILACRFTGVFYGVDRPEDVMQSLSEALNADFTVTPAGKYRLSGKGCE